MAIHSCLPLGGGGCILRQVRRLGYINDIIARTGKLDLGEVVDQIIISAMRIDDDDLMQPVTGDFTAGILHQADDQLRLNANGAGHVAGFQDLGKDEIRENDRRFKGSGAVA